MQAYVAVETLDQKLQYFSKKTPGDCLLSSDFPTCCSNSLLSYHIKALIETIEELQQYFTSLIVQWSQSVISVCKKGLDHDHAKQRPPAPCAFHNMGGFTDQQMQWYAMICSDMQCTVYSGCLFSIESIETKGVWRFDLALVKHAHCEQNFNSDLSSKHGPRMSVLQKSCTKTETRTLFRWILSWPKQNKSQTSLRALDIEMD